MKSLCFKATKLILHNFMQSQDLTGLKYLVSVMCSLMALGKSLLLFLGTVVIILCLAICLTLIST